VDKQHIIDEIKRTAAANGGIALGEVRFAVETGIAKRDWWCKHWRTWGEAVVEAGCEPNRFNSAYPDDWIMEKLALLVRELGRFPSNVDFRMRHHADPAFPSRNVFYRLGRRKAILMQRLAAFCRQRSGFDDVLAVVETVKPSELRSTLQAEAAGSDLGVVYLIKSGRHYKIGHTNALARREYELAIQLPAVHRIKTDDPEGIERYWHERFKNRRADSEWFNLSASDVAAFKRRRFM